MPDRRHAAAVVFGSLLMTSLLTAQTCGGSSSAPTCGVTNDNVTSQQDQITVANVTLAVPVCEVLSTPGVQIVANSSGKASTQFSDGANNIASCAFYQLPGTPKAASFAVRDPANALFTDTNGEADCSGTAIVPEVLCGLGTMYPDGTTSLGNPLSATGMCNNDPYFYVAVYRGHATVRLASSPVGSKGEPVGENDAVTFDPAVKTFVHSVPKFTPAQISLFDVQLDALAGRVSLTDPTSLLRVRTLSASSVVVAPNTLQSKLGQSYGIPAPMCQAASSSPVVFYPADLKAATPQIGAVLCSNKTASVYGVAIYRQAGIGFSGTYFKSGGGTLLRTDVFEKPLSLFAGRPQGVFTWDAGSVPRDVYVLKFLYDLPPDTTPRIGFVAVSLFGAPYPTQIQ